MVKVLIEMAVAAAVALEWTWQVGAVDSLGLTPLLAVVEWLVPTTLVVP